MSVNGKRIVVTGANTGIGFETAASLAGMGAKVVLTARDGKKGGDAVAAIKERHPDADVTNMDIDLSSFASVHGFADAYKQRYDSLDVLINNAGLLLDTRTVTADGNETQFQVNHLGPFLLTNLLLDTIKKSAPSRIVNVSSTAHRGGRLNFDDLQTETGGYTAMRVYSMTKLCNILFTRELARRLEGTGVTVNALHPGTVRTGFGKDGDTKGLLAIGFKLGGLVFKTPRQGARTSVLLASGEEVEGKTGGYWVGKNERNPSSAARDVDAAKRLWEESARIVGLTEART